MELASMFTPCLQRQHPFLFDEGRIRVRQRHDHPRPIRQRDQLDAGVSDAGDEKEY